MKTARVISPDKLRERILSGEEIAVVDVRPGATFAAGQIFHSRSVSLDSLELRISDLVPRLSTEIVVVDDETSRMAGQSAGMATARLTDLGYKNVHVLQDGFDGWKALGFEVFTGTNVPSKAFGEFVEHVYATPRISADELAARIEKKERLVILDARPYEEYTRFHIPGGIDTPGAELVYRVHDLAPDPKQLIVVNCAGRTRSIIGAQSLINAKLPNPIVALKNGTMGWHLAGFELESGPGKIAPRPSKAARRKAIERVRRVAVCAGVAGITLDELNRWRREKNERTLYLFDVRQPEEFRRGHVPGSRNAPGGQLIQETDRYVGTLGSRIVLVDDDGVRATMTASWLIQMGWREVVILQNGLDGPLETGADKGAVLSRENAMTKKISVSELKAEIDQDRSPVVVDLAASLDYRQGHIPGAYWTMRSRLAESLDAVRRPKRLVLTSVDAMVALLAAFDIRHAAQATDVLVLDGGNEAWKSAGYPLETGFDRALSEPIDMWYEPYDCETTVEERMQQYLTWEVGLLRQVERDGMANFRKLVDD